MAFLTYKGNLVGGDDFSKYYSSFSRQSSSQDIIHTVNGPTAIVELYMDTTDAYSALGLKRDNSEMSPSASKNYDTDYPWERFNTRQLKGSYDFKDKSFGNKIYVDSNSLSSPRKVFALHYKNTSISLYPVHLVFGAKPQSTSWISSAYFGITKSVMNEWATHTAGNGRIYKSITVNANNKFIGTSISVVKGKKYTFNMHTVSQASCDGIIISTSSMTSGSVTTGGIARCSGVNVTNTYTHIAKSSGTIYIYFKTDSSVLGDKYEATDTNGTASYDDFTTGDIEIIVEPIKTEVTIDLNGGSGGDSKKRYYEYGLNMSGMVMETSLPKKDNCTFVGYYTGSSRNSPGTMYINYQGKGVRTWDITETTCTLYALYDYSRSIVSSWNRLHCVYCTSSAASISTLQASAQITLGEISPSIAGAITCSQLNVNASNHLGNLTMTSDKKTVTIPGGIARGDYIFEIKYTFTPNETSVLIKEETQECKIWIIPTYIVTETMELPSPVPDSLVQKEDIPAGSFTLNNNNVSEYFKIHNTTTTPMPSTSTLIYNNGKSASSTPQITWSISSSTTFASLGTTITGRDVYDIPNNPLISMEVENRRYNGSYYDNRNKVIEIISDTLQRDDVGYYSQFKTLGVDSLNYADIVDGIETTYNISIPIGDLKYIYSVDLLCKYLYVFHNIGNGLQSSATIVPPLINASYNSTKVYREANEVTNLHISVSENPIYVDDTATLNTIADFTSGSEGVSVNGLETFSGYDTSIIQIDNT